MDRLRTDGLVEDGRSLKTLLAGLFAVLFAAAVGLITGCQRSPAYQRDQAYYTPDTPSYYNKAGTGGRTPASRVEQQGQPKKRVYVLGFWNDTPIKAGDIGMFASDELKRGLFLSQRVIVPQDLRTEKTTEDFVASDKVRVAQLIREGRKMGVSALVVGRIAKITFRQRGDQVGILRQTQTLAAAEVEVKVFDVVGGREVFSTSRSAEIGENAMVAFEAGNLESQEFRQEMTKGALRKTMVMVAPEVLKAIEKLSWEGQVARIAGQKVYVNAGRSAGLIAGDILKILTDGDEIFDPKSGAYLGRTEGKVKGTVEIIDFAGPDAAVAEVHTGGGFSEGDKVRLY